MTQLIPTNESHCRFLWGNKPGQKYGPGWGPLLGQLLSHCYSVMSQQNIYSRKGQKAVADLTVSIISSCWQGPKNLDNWAPCCVDSPLQFTLAMSDTQLWTWKCTFISLRRQWSNGGGVMLRYLGTKWIALPANCIWNIENIYIIVEA